MPFIKQVDVRELLATVILVSIWLGTASSNYFALVEWRYSYESAVGFFCGFFGFFFWLWGGEFLAYWSAGYVLRRNWFLRNLALSLAVISFMAAIYNVNWIGLFFVWAAST